MSDHNPVIIGAGPAGLACGYEAVNQGLQPLILEQSTVVGGIARTVQFRGYRFDLGPHRFFTKEPQIQQIWDDMLGSDFLLRRRLTRIYHKGHLFRYPLRLPEALTKLRLIESLRILGSYLAARANPVTDAQNFEQWVTHHFGRRLFQIFFKTYTEKVWGMPCKQIDTDWAVQRIRTLSLGEAFKHALGLNRHRHTSLVAQFHYPRLGAGMMGERVADHITGRSGQIAFDHRVIQLNHANRRIISVVVETAGGCEQYATPHLISSMPLPELIFSLEPPPPAPILQAARALRHRYLIVVGLIIDDAEVFPDNWIYIHSPKARVTRIQNYKNWSPQMVANPAKSSIGLEYCCWATDSLWTRPDHDLIELATQEASLLGLIDPVHAEKGTVMRVPRAYPVYDLGYAQRVGLLREYLGGFSNLQLIGRNGMHRYNNMDHSMMTGLLAARNICGEHHDLWQVNMGEEYLEAAGK